MTKPIAPVFDEIAKCIRCFADCGIDVPRPEIPDNKRIRVVLIGEQPTSQGSAEKPLGLSNDPALTMLRDYMKQGGVALDETLYMTAVLCLPKDETRRGDRPSSKEVKNCSAHVRTVLAHVAPQLVVTLGHTALLSLQHAHRDWTKLGQFILNYDVGNVLEGNQFNAYPLYFPSESTLRARPEYRQQRDWQRIPSILSTPVRNAS